MSPVPPIGIVTAGRSGSSMVAGLFAEHGVWVGTSRPPDARNPRGYFEMLSFKKALHDRGIYAHDGFPCDDPGPDFAAEIHDRMAAEGYPGGPWLIKCSVMYAPALTRLAPRWVTVRRRPEAVIESYLDSKMLRGDRERLSEIVRRCEEALTSLEWQGALRVDAEALIRHDFGQIQAVFDALGLVFHVERARKWIDRTLWTH